MSERPHASPKPQFLGSLIGILSVSAFFLIAVFLSHFFKGYAVVQEQQAFHSAISSDFNIRTVLHQDFLRRLPPQKLQKVQQIVELVNQVERGDFNRAEQVLRSQPLLEREAQDRLAQGIAKLQKTKDEAKQKKELRKVQEQLLNRVTQRFSILQRDYGRELGFNVAPSDPKLSDENANAAASLAVYSEGYLSGLPVIPGIPDGLTSVPSVAPYLVPDRKELIIRELPYPGTEIRKQIDLLREQVSKLQAEHAQVSAEIVGLSSTVPLSESDTANVGREAKELGLKLIASNTAIDISPHTQLSYELGRRILSTQGYMLPALQTNSSAAGKSPLLEAILERTAPLANSI